MVPHRRTTYVGPLPGDKIPQPASELMTNNNEKETNLNLRSCGSLSHYQRDTKWLLILITMGQLSNAITTFSYTNKRPILL